MSFFVFAFNFNTLSPAFFILGIMVPELILKSLGLRTMPEHWLNHGSFLSGQEFPFEQLTEYNENLF